VTLPSGAVKKRQKSSGRAFPHRERWPGAGNKQERAFARFALLVQSEMTIGIDLSTQQIAAGFRDESTGQ
jgi:hypothetical protein